MTARTFNELFEPPIILTLVRTEPDGYVVMDQHGMHYTLAASPLTFCLKFMAAMARKKDAVIDDQSVERATWAAAYSVKVPEGSLTLGGVTAPADVLSGRTEGVRAPEASVGDNVLAFRRRPHQQLEEPTIKGA